MKATTLKIENPLLGQLNNFKPKDMSFSAFIRDILEHDVKRRKMMEAAEQYAQFLASEPEEEKWLTEWEKSNLVAPPRRRKGKRAS